MAMKPITSFFNSPPPKTIKSSSLGGADLHSVPGRKNDENCNGHAAVFNGKGTESVSKRNCDKKSATKEKNRLSRKKSLLKEKSKVEEHVVVEVEDTEETSMPDSSDASVHVKMSVEMNYEDFLTSSDPVDDEQAENEISVIKDSSEESSTDVVVIESGRDTKPMDNEDSQGSQDLFLEDDVAGCPSVKNSVQLVTEKLEVEHVCEAGGSSEKTVKEKRNTKLSRKAKKESIVECSEKAPEKSEGKEKSGKKLSRSKLSGGKQMTLFGKVIENVPKLEMDAETDAEAKPGEDVEEEIVDSLPAAAAPKSKSIMNFFSKVDKKFPFVKKPSSEKVTCRAEIHKPTEGEANSSFEGTTMEISVTPETKQKVSPRRTSNVAVEAIDMSITELGSTIITVTEKRKRTRRQLIEPSSEATKAICETVSENDQQRPGEKDSDVSSIKNDEQSTTVVNENQSVNDSVVETVDDDLVIVGATEEKDKELRKAQITSQMAYLDTVKVSVSKKTTQATLNFSGKGSIIQKVEKSVVQEETEKKAEKFEDSDFEIVSVSNKEKKKSAKGSKAENKKGRKKNIRESITPPKSRHNERCAAASPAKTPSKRVYSSRILPPRRNSLPGLRMKFTSIRSFSADKNSTTDIEEIAKITAKMSKAQQILDRAKKTSQVKSKPKQKASTQVTISKATKKAIQEEIVSLTQRRSSGKGKTQVKMKISKAAKNGLEEIVSPSLRRSSRHSSVVARTAIAECLSPAEFLSPKGKLKTKMSPSKTPSKTPRRSKTKQEKNEDRKSPRKSPKKKVKLASIFKSKGGMQDDSDDDVKVTKVQVDPELLRVRREFLLSGVPETLKKQAEANSVVVVDDYPPLPEVSHVQQLPGSNKDPLSAMFNLKPISLPFLKHSEPCPAMSYPHERICKGSLTSCADNYKLDVQLIGVEDKAFEEETLKYLLAEVSAKNPTFPVRRVYKQLTKKYEQTKGTWVEPVKPNEKDESKDKKNSKKRKLTLGETEEPTRRSKRRRAASDVNIKSDEDECCIVEDAPIPENLDKSRELLWTDKYSPSSSTEVLANTMYSKRLKSWLDEWRQRTDHEMKKIKKQLMKEAKKDSKIKEEIQKSLGDSWWTDDESDFEIDTEDDSDYDEDNICDGLCNTMVLTGPHGVGKTAMVYAVAQELGYKIFEVNASSKRAGKQMLAELQEATQSHQVAQHNMDKLFTTFKMIQAERRKSLEVAKPEKKMNSVFANFFTNTSKPAAQQKGNKTPKKTPEKPGKGKKGTPGKKTGNTEQMDAFPKKGLNLNSTSLILFEEVDVIFEEDKGFWTAIETFMNTTKRPIILTASDSKVAAAVNRRHEIIKMKPSPLINLASYMQLMCLAEKLRSDHDDVVKLVRSCNGDLRQAILTLQYWILSGGGSSKLTKPIKYNPMFFNKKQDAVPRPVAPLLMKHPVSGFDSGKDSEEEFEITAFTKKRRWAARVVLDSGDESSNSSPVKPMRINSLQMSQSDSLAEESQDEQSSVAAVVEKDLSVAQVIAPHIHGLSWHSSAGPSLQGVTSNGDLLQALRDPTESSQAWKLVTWYLSSRFDLVYANLTQLLDLPKVQLIPPRLPSSVSCKNDVKTRRRIKLNTDIFDCEDSNDGSERGADTAKMEVDEKSKDAKQLDTQEKIEGKEALPCIPTVEDAIAASGVKTLSELYDNLSYGDACFANLETSMEGPCSRDKSFGWSCGQLCAGLTDCHRSEEQCNTSLACDFRAGLHLYSMHRANGKLQQLKRKMDSLDINLRKKANKLLSLPVPTEKFNLAELQLSSECATQIRVRACRRQAVEHVSSCLPLCVQCNRRAMTTDVMPYVRNICQSEQLRQASNTKRRFTHYLDSISLGVTRKQPVLDVLCTSFT